MTLDDGTEHTVLRNDGVSFWKWDNGSDDMGMGKCGSWAGYYCGPGYVQRLRIPKGQVQRTPAERNG
ncbi:hypothetical protein ACIPRL_29980 [Streptomyces sp. NPDC090085]|uniref:hypothetical protein n=1 Tax=Streptomyces sp. NPDC090085 TaxID=3365943 RepID=UPI0037F10680